MVVFPPTKILLSNFEEDRKKFVKFPLILFGLAAFSIGSILVTTDSWKAYQHDSMLICAESWKSSRISNDYKLDKSVPLVLSLTHHLIALLSEDYVVWRLFHFEHQNIV